MYFLKILYFTIVYYVTSVYKSNHRCLVMQNIRTIAFFCHSRTSKSAHDISVVKYCCSKCSCTFEPNCVRNSKGKRRDHCVSGNIQMTTTVSKLIRSTYLRFLASISPSPGVHHSLPPNVHLGTVLFRMSWPRIDSSTWEFLAFKIYVIWYTHILQ